MIDSTPSRIPSSIADMNSIGAVSRGAPFATDKSTPKRMSPSSVCVVHHPLSVMSSHDGLSISS